MNGVLTISSGHTYVSIVHDAHSVLCRFETRPPDYSVCILRYAIMANTITLAELKKLKIADGEIMDIDFKSSASDDKGNKVEENFRLRVNVGGTSLYDHVASGVREKKIKLGQKFTREFNPESFNEFCLKLPQEDGKRLIERSFEHATSVTPPKTRAEIEQEMRDLAAGDPDLIAAIDAAFSK